MKIKKTISFDGYTKADVIKVSEDGSVLCNIFEVTGSDENGDIIRKSDTNISFPDGAWPFSLTQEEIGSLNLG